MEHNIIYEKEPEEMTDEELTAELKESYKNERKIEILEKTPFEKWTKDELIEVIMEFGLRKCANSLEDYINTIPEFVLSGLYKKYQRDFEEYKITELTEEMKKELSEIDEEQRPHSILQDLPLIEWSKCELLEFVLKYNKHYEDWWDF